MSAAMYAWSTLVYTVAAYCWDSWGLTVAALITGTMLLGRLMEAAR